MTDPFADAKSDFMGAKDYCTVEGPADRLILFYGQAVETEIPSKAKGSEGETYDRVIGDVVVLDGPISDKFPEVPGIIKGQFFNGKALVPSLTHRQGKEILPMDRPVLGRVVRFKNSFGNWSPKIDTPTDADKDVARRWLASTQGKEYLASLDPFA
jgi:hypothetical protein